jgi:hypothetical protein
MTVPEPVRQILIAAIVLALVVAISYRDPSRGDLASCNTDKPVNIVMCVDLGAGHHSLMETLQPPRR